MCQSGPVVVIFRRKEDLRLVDEPAESLGMDDTVPVALVICSESTLLFRKHPSPGLSCLGCQRRQHFIFSGLNILSFNHSPILTSYPSTL